MTGQGNKRTRQLGWRGRGTRLDRARQAFGDAARGSGSLGQETAILDVDSSASTQEVSMLHQRAPSQVATSTKAEASTMEPDVGPWPSS